MGVVPAIHADLLRLLLKALARRHGVDGRDEHGHDGRVAFENLLAAVFAESDSPWARHRHPRRPAEPFLKALVRCHGVDGRDKPGQDAER